MNDISVAKVLKVGDCVEIEGNFFIINKQDIKGGMGKPYSRYNLKTLLKKEKMDKLNEYLIATGRVDANSIKNEEGEK